MRFKVLKSSVFRGKDSGFSTIEVLISLVILSVALIPIIQVQLNLQQSTIRLEQIDARNRVLSDALKYIRLINPAVEPEGKKDLRLGNLTWTSELAASDTTINQYFDSGARSIGLFKMSIFVIIDEEIVLEKEIYQLGWSSVGEVAQSN